MAIASRVLCWPSVPWSAMAIASAITIAIACGGNKETEPADRVQAATRKRSAQAVNGLMDRGTAGPAAGHYRPGQVGVLVWGPPAAVRTPQQRARIGHECRF
jgi:hypothetical protein